MYLFKNDQCSPATIYIFIAVIMVMVFLFFSFIQLNSYGNMSSLVFSLCVQFVSILVCYIMIVGLCSINMTVAWIVIILISLCTLSTIISMIFSPAIPNVVVV